MKRDAASERQVQAADPGRSTWLSANAGSGKTRVLTDRVARLLLEGVDPSHILCLTYTKAAASEMQNRLFKRLGSWAMLDTDALRTELRQLGLEKTLSAEFLQEARTLFARAIETPGGLRIQTIHSFCAALLRRFPLEAGVSPQFREMEDRAAELMRAELLDRMAEGPEAALVQTIAPFVQGDDTGALLAEITRRRADFEPPRSRAEIRAAYGLNPDTNETTLAADLLSHDTLGFIARVAGLCLTQGSGNDLKLGEALAEATTADAAGLDALEAALLTQKGEPRKKLVNKALAEGALAPHLPRLEALTEQVLETRGLRLALAAAERDAALHGFARAFLPAYEAEKLRRGWLDFDDLIQRARNLLTDDKVAAWVLYRLDGGIDHILVDEAQDTSPLQWQVIERLAQEFTAGQGAREVRRTIFVVGDKKQSIYSFQGADPSEFDRMRAEFKARLERTEAPLVATELEYSFRSAEPILRLVDCTFEGAEESGFVQEQRHRAFKDAMPGRVDLWPPVPATKDDADGDWYDPVDRTGTRHHSAVLAERIARFVRDTIDARTPLPVEDGQGGYAARPVHAGDFLILVRGRSRLFTEIIRACKQAGLPIAGADRLRVMAELAVRDIVALLRFLATQEDDLSLACALRSPLFGLSEQQLFTLAHGRKGYLWESLRQHRADFPDTVDVLRDLRGQTDFLRPYDLIDRILTRHRGRQRLVGRLGSEAEDGIDALLGQALAYEQTEVPSLTGFLQWAQSDDLEIKRAPDAAGERLRVMTVHGAKGLEAPIVILPDCGKPDESLRDSLLADPQGLLWKTAAETRPARQAAVVERAQEAEARERDRLLYVGMTRAEKWLVVAAAGELGKNGRSWYEQVRRGMERAGAVPAVHGFGDPGAGEGLRLGAGWEGLPLTDAPRPAVPLVVLPVHLDRPAPPPPPRAEARSPSDLGGAKALPGEAGEDTPLALARGTATHLLLDWLAPLPVEDRLAVSEKLIETLAADPDTHIIADRLPAIRDEALALLGDPALGWLFAPGTLSEVSVTAELPGIGRIHGVIDRLIVTPDRVLAVDFKTNRVLPATADTVPEGLLRQMGAYAAALAQVFPGRRIETGLVWTAGPAWMPLAHEMVTRALAQATAS